MGFTKLQDLNPDTVISLGGYNKKTRKDNPTTVEGYYLGSRKVTNKKGDCYIHVFQTPEGSLGVWGKTDMDRKVLTVTPGTMTQINFVGMKQTQNGEMYKFDVAIDEDQTIEVSATTETPFTGSIGEENVEYNDSNDDNFDSEVDIAASKAREDRTKSLLNKGKSKTN